MRSAFIASLLVGTALGLNTNSKPVITQEYVDKINSIEGNTWTASETNGIITGANLGEIKRLLGFQKDAMNSLPERVFTEEEKVMAIPDSFDSAAHWPQCSTITHIWDQSDCGSCWAVGAASSMSDRLCTTGTNKRVQFLSARDMMSCCPACGDGCNGGNPWTAWSYWVTNGLVTEACQPYPYPSCAHDNSEAKRFPPCPKKEYPNVDCAAKCTGNSSSATMAHIKGATNYSLWGEENFQRELMLNGPFEVAFEVYNDFPAYKSGVYIQHSNVSLGGHCVRIVGWGVLDGIKYWKIANSWNADWGMNGYFLIQRGVDMCGIEDMGAAGLAL